MRPYLHGWMVIHVTLQALVWLHCKMLRLVTL